MSVSVEPPPEAFNFAGHLLDANAVRPDKVAFIDDERRMTYRELDERVRRFAAALTEAGVKREERVLLLMLNSCDWPVTFLGAIFAGVVPVAVNTLLTADDYAYMLEHARAQAAIVSGSLKPALKAAMTRSDHEVHKVIVSRPAHPLDVDEVEFEAFLESPSAAGQGRPHARRRTRFLALFVGFDRKTQGNRPFARQSVLDGRALRQGDPEPPRGGHLLLCGEAVFRLRARQRPDLSAVGRRDRSPDGRAADAGRGVPALARRGRGVKPTVFFGAPTGFAGMLASPDLPRREEIALRLVSSAGEALPAEIGERFKRHFGVDIVDGIGSTEMLHIFISNRPDKVRYGTTGWPVPGYEIELRGEGGALVPDGEPGDLYIHGPSAALMYWGNRDEVARDVSGRLDQGRRQIHPQRRRLPDLRRPHR